MWRAYGKRLHVAQARVRRKCVRSCMCARHDPAHMHVKMKCQEKKMVHFMFIIMDCAILCCSYVFVYDQCIRIYIITKLMRAL